MYWICPQPYGKILCASSFLCCAGGDLLDAVEGSHNKKKYLEELQLRWRSVIATDGHKLIQILYVD